MSKKINDSSARRKYEFIKANQRKYNTMTMCRLLGVGLGDMGKRRSLCLVAAPVLSLHQAVTIEHGVYRADGRTVHVVRGIRDRMAVEDKPLTGEEHPQDTQLAILILGFAATFA